MNAFLYLTILLMLLPLPCTAILTKKHNRNGIIYHAKYIKHETNTHTSIEKNLTCEEIYALNNIDFTTCFQDEQSYEKKSTIIIDLDENFDLDKKSTDVNVNLLKFLIPELSR